MIYIDGLGYVNNQVQSVSNNNNSVSNNFDEILASEQSKIADENKTMSLLDIFDEASKKYNVSVDLLKAVAYHESGFQADATSYVGAMGIMQLMPSTAEWMGVEDAYDPYQNIMGGAKLLGILQDMYDGNIPLMLAGYNAGMGNVEKYGGVPPFTETQNYVKNIMATLQGSVDVPDTAYVTPATSIDEAASAVNTSPQVASTMPKTVEEALAETVQELLASINTASFSHFKSTNLDSIFTYSDYEILVKYFDNMMDIISRIGEDDSDDSNSSYDLYKNNNLVYNKNNIKFF